MQRRQAVALLVGAAAGRAAKTPADLNRFVDPGSGAALLIEVRTGQLIAVNSEEAAGRRRMSPGSTLKPFVLFSLLQTGRLSPDTSFLCPTRLSIGSRRLDCSHPRLSLPMRLDTALAYSCNCFVARMAERLERDEPAKGFVSFGLASRTGLVGSDEAVGAIASPSTPDAQRLQALGEGGVVVTAVELAVAYRRLALKAALPEMQPILAGLEGAVEYGTAQRAAVAGVRVAGKTGTSRSAAGNRFAWFAGFLPSRAPEVVVTVMLAGRSGGSDAAPVASKILEAYRRGRL